EKDAATKSGIPLQQAMASGAYAIQSLDLEPAELIAQVNDLIVRGEVFSPDDRAPVVLIGIVRADGTPVYGVASDMDGAVPDRVFAHRFRFALSLPALALLPGKYYVQAHAADPEGLRLFDQVERPLVVTGRTRELGFVRLPHSWQLRTGSDE